MKIVKMHEGVNGDLVYREWGIDFWFWPMKAVIINYE